MSDPNAIDDLLDARPNRPGTFPKGCPPGPGKPPGSAAALLTRIRKSIESALEGAGDDLRDSGHGGDGGAETYMRWLAKAEPRAFAGLIGKLMPNKIAGSDDPDDKPVLVERIVREIVHPGAKAPL